MDYLLAAHIQVTGGADAAAQFNQLAVQINNFGTAARNASTGTMATAMDKAAESGGRLQGVMTQVGVAITRMATYQGLGLVVGALKDAANGILDFDDKMTQSLAIQEGVTGRMREQMEGLAKSIAVDLGMAPSKVAEGFYFLASAGLTVEQQLAALPVVADFAKAGMMSLEKATEKLYDSLTALGLKSKDPQEQMRNLIMLSDLLVTAAIASQGSVQDFTTALANKAGGDIKSYGIDLKEGIALLEVFADRGIKGAKAGTAFDQTIRDMAIKAVTNADAFKKFGIEVYNSEGNFNSLSTIFGQLDAALLHLPLEQRTQALKEMGYTLRSGQIVQSLLGTKEAFDGFKQGLDEAGGTAQRVAEKQMESLRAKMAQMRSLSIVFAIDGFEKLQEAASWIAETFAPVILEIIDILGKLAAGVKPVAVAFGGLIAASVVKGIEGVAAALDFVFGIIADHPGVVEGLGAALAGIAAAQILTSLARIGIALGETIYAKALLAQDAINGLIIKIMNVAATEGAFAALKAGISGILSALASPVAIGAGIGLALYEWNKLAQDGKKYVKEIREGLETKYDTSSVTGMKSAIIEMQAEAQKFIDQAKSKGFSIGDILAAPGDFQKIRAFEAEMKQMNKEYANMEIGLSLIANAATGANLPIGAWGEAMEKVGLHIKDMPINELRGKISDLGIDMSAAGANTEGLKRLLEDIAKQSGIDIKAPVENWVPKLAEAYEKFVKVRDITHDIGGVAEGSSAGMSSMEKAITTLRDEAATAEDKLKALKTAMDGLSGGGQSVFDMETKFSEAMEKMRTTLEKNGTSFSSFTEAGRENRDMLSSSAEAAKDFAVAQAEQSGNMQVGVEHLKSYADALAGTLRQAGLAEPEIQKLLTAMGLTPEQIETLFKITMPEGEPQKTQGELDNTANPGGEGRKAPIAPEVKTQEQIKAEDSLAELASARTASVSPEVPEPPLTTADNQLNNASRARDADMTAQAHNWVETDRTFNQTARDRTSNANQTHSGDPGTETSFNQSARDRSSNAHQTASGWADVDRFLSNAARDRTSHVNVVYTTSGASFPDAFAVGESGNYSADGNIFPKHYASGGFENHRAQIAKATNRMRFWAEPETGGEAYIPLAIGKRSRSLAIWEETGRLLGAGPSTTKITAPVNVNVNVSGASDPEATGRAAAAMAGKTVEQAMRRILVEMNAV